MCAEADCSAAIQNMLIAAESLNIGSCWVGLVKFLFESNEEIGEFTFPEGYKPFYVVCLGYKNDLINSAKPKRKHNVVEYIR